MLLFYVLFALLVALNVVDTILTDKVLARGGRELNPVLARLMDAIGTLPAMLLLKAVALVLIWWLLGLIPQAAPWIAGVLCLAYGYLCWHNWRQLT